MQISSDRDQQQASIKRPRRRAIIAVSLALAIGFASASYVYIQGRLRGPTPKSWPTTDINADQVVAYKQGDKRELHLHLFKPVGPPTGTMVFFHGGGLRNTPLFQFVRQAEHLRDQGMLTVIAEYQVRWDGASLESAAVDAIDAVTWVNNHADELHIDNTKIAVGGASVGGALSAKTELTPGAGHPDALVLFNPAVNGSYANSSGGVTTLVMHGDDDHSVPLSAAEEYCDALTTCELMIWPGGDHGFFNDGEAFDATLARVDAFLRTIGYLPHD